MSKNNKDPLLQRATDLGLHGLIEHWDAIGNHDWVAPLIAWEEGARQRRSFERRLRSAKIGRFKDLVDFDWAWPKKVDRVQIEELFSLKWIDEAHNAIFVGPNGVGKTMLSQNLAYAALRRGYSVRCVSASELLNDLAAQESASGLQRRVRAYAAPALLCIDELGYLSYNNRHADLLFEVVTRRYNKHSTVVTTNLPFSEWNKIFASATCVVTLVDRLVHHSEIIHLDGESYRLKESQENHAQRTQRRAGNRKQKTKDEQAEAIVA